MKLTTSILTGALIALVAPPSLAVEGTNSTAPVVAPKSKANVPVYKPPLRGAPAAGRLIGGGSRGTVRASTVVVLAPEHLGLTSKGQPSLFWYMAQPSPARLELTLIEEGNAQPTVEIALLDAKSGIAEIDLGQHGITLKQDVEYEWSIALVQNPEQRSYDVISRGSIQRIEPSSTLTGKVKGAASEQLPFIYAEEGLWYDAIEAVSKLIDASPRDEALRAQRAALLEQIGLNDIVKIAEGAAPF